MTDVPRPRAILFEEEHARMIVARLERDGYQATLTRERYAGEDDDEDHAWAVVSDAPRVMLELYVDEYDGWLDEGAGSSGVQAPLPRAPIRFKRPVRE